MVERKKDTNTDDDDSLNKIHRRLQQSGAANLTAEPGTPSAWDRVKLARHPSRVRRLSESGSRVMLTAHTPSTSSNCCSPTSSRSTAIAASGTIRRW